eukprot:TRINITY_DN21879_c0_g1_i2.p1 TRINITY_DN21879_c0_g1~~TRINITY_DN21879_c0_g1_i2.p1  ORF type:complete len:531 (+),score=61.06 TRINITY_DN21879_c0_g1_i2:114-1706(+)
MGTDSAAASFVASSFDSSTGRRPLIESEHGVSLVEQSPPDVAPEDGRAGGADPTTPGAAASAELLSEADKALCRRNVRAMMIFQLLNAVIWSAAMGPVFDRYLYYLGGDGIAKGPSLMPHHARNSLVGLSESISGIVCLVVAVPVGYLVDKNPEKRARLLRLSGVFGLAAAAIAIVAVLFDILILIYAMLFLMGIFSELSSSASEALFADSIPAGERSKLFTTKGIVATVGGAIGPIISGCCLYLIGDTWQPHQMKTIIVFGFALVPPCCFSLGVFRDPPIVKTEDKENSTESANGNTETAQASPTERSRAVKTFGPLGPKHVPVILALSDFITCIGAGMTVKFFNLFFIKDHNFTPIEICVLQAAYPLVIALFMKFTERLAKPIGRAQASLLFFSCSVLCLFLLSEIESLPWLLAFFLIRGGFANSTYPLDRSVLMDFTPSSQRGCWNAISSLTSMTWSGSAFIGGLLADSHDYRFTFLVTALVYATACIIYSPLTCLVPRREKDAAGAEREAHLLSSPSSPSVGADAQ